MHHNDLKCKNRNAKIAGYLNFIISKTIGGIKFFFFLHADTYLLKLQIDNVILGGRDHACSNRLLELVGSPVSSHL